MRFRNGEVTYGLQHYIKDFFLFISNLKTNYFRFCLSDLI